MAAQEVGGEEPGAASSASAEAEAQLRLASLILWRGAPLLPALAAAILVALTEATRQMAVRSGHVDVYGSHSSGRVRLAFPAISPATRLPPERWIWTCGVCLVCIGFIGPTFVAGWEVWRAAGRFHSCSCAYKGLFGSLLIACVGLVVEACIPLQPDILEYEELTVQSQVHLYAASVFFMAAIMHGAAAIVLQCYLSIGWRALDVPSMLTKLLSAVVVGLSLLSNAPFLILSACPEDVCDPRARWSDVEGLRQRGTVVGVALFLASYGFDLRAMQLALQPPGQAGGPAGGGEVAKVPLLLDGRGDLDP